MTAGKLTSPAPIKPTVHVLNFIFDLFGLMLVVCCYRRTRWVGLKKAPSNTLQGVRHDLCQPAIGCRNKLIINELSIYLCGGFPPSPMILERVGQISPAIKSPSQ